MSLTLCYQSYMTVDTLIVTVDRQDYTFAEQMNIQTNVLIGNQCSKDAVERFCINGNDAVCYCTTDRGVGINRNLLLDRSKADICVMADDDLHFVDGYPEIAIRAFRECPDADVLIFNLIEKVPRRHVNTRIVHIHGHNYSKYGTARIVLKRESVNAAGIRFSPYFGGGATYCSGEDSIFLRDCLKKGLRVYAVPYALAEIDQDAFSTWFHGYTEEFFYDKGALYACLHGAMCRPYIIRFVLKRRKKIDGQIFLGKALCAAFKGAEEYRKGKPKKCDSV